MIDETEQKRFTLRIDIKLFERIKERAKKERRAVGKEIEYLTEYAIENLNRL